MTEKSPEELQQFLVPAGKDGFFYEPEILEVLEKFAKLKVDLSDPGARELLCADIGKRIREIPLQPVSLPDKPARLISSHPMGTPKDG